MGTLIAPLTNTRPLSTRPLLFYPVRFYWHFCLSQCLSVSRRDPAKYFQLVTKLLIARADLDLLGINPNSLPPLSNRISTDVIAVKGF